MWLEALLAPEARSPRSTSATESPLRAARRAIPAPVIPPPRITRSNAFFSAAASSMAPPSLLAWRGAGRARGPDFRALHRLARGRRPEVLSERVLLDPVE